MWKACSTGMECRWRRAGRRACPGFIFAARLHHRRASCGRSALKRSALQMLPGPIPWRFTGGQLHDRQDCSVCREQPALRHRKFAFDPVVLATAVGGSLWLCHHVGTGGVRRRRYRRSGACYSRSQVLRGDREIRWSRCWRWPSHRFWRRPLRAFRRWGAAGGFRQIRSRLRQMWSFGGPIAAVSIGYVILAASDRLLIASILGPAAAGAYSAASGLAGPRIGPASSP